MPDREKRVHFPAIDKINKEIAKLQAERNNLELRAIKDGGYKDWQELNAEYLKWESERS
jgi:hypothetical protein